MFSKACEYGIRAVIFVAAQSLRDERASLKAIAQEIESPEAYTAKIMQQITRKGLVHSVMGPTGGFKLEEKQIRQITLSDIVDAIDGQAIYRSCGIGLKECDPSHPCPLHDQFAVIRNNLQSMLENTRIYDLATGLEGGLTCLRR